MVLVDGKDITAGGGSGGSPRTAQAGVATKGSNSHNEDETTLSLHFRKMELGGKRTVNNGSSSCNGEDQVDTEGNDGLSRSAVSPRCKSRGCSREQLKRSENSRNAYMFITADGG